MKKLMIFLIISLGLASLLQAQPDSLPPDLIFIPDTGLRIDCAALPKITYDTLSDSFFLIYEDLSHGIPGEQRIASSHDGIHFGPGRLFMEDDYVHHPFRVHLPDGSWRMFYFEMPSFEMKSSSSMDGAHFVPDTGIRYYPPPGDSGRIGVHDEYLDIDDNVVCLYIGDMYGLNNIRMAYSTDGGWNFFLERTNVLNDSAFGGGPNSYVDPKSILLPDGRRRLFVMKMNEIFSFISTNGRDYVQEPGMRLNCATFTEFEATSLNDPLVIRIPDGRYRMYVASLIQFAPADRHFAIVSATTLPETGINENDSPIIIDNFNILCYPNPFNSVVHIKIAPVETLPLSFEALAEGDATSPQDVTSPQVEIFDIYGRLVLRSPLTPLTKGGKYNDENFQEVPPLVRGVRGDLSFPQSPASYPLSFSWNPEPSLSSGIYLIKFSTSKEQKTSKILFLK